MRLPAALILAAIATMATTSGPSTALASVVQSAPTTQEGAFANFAPSTATTSTKLDWTFYDEALDWFVLYMGPSLREAASRTQPIVGTRMRYGHESRYRMEGNRIAFEYIEDEELSALTEYRRSLEQIGTELNVATLPRNEQLAYWLNLHNVAMIEQIALAYPVGEPRNIRIGGVPLDEARVITVDGVAMSPQDIRTKIVYPNWRDSRVIYGFFRGDIGSPSLQELAFTGANVDMLLDLAGTEFVNSLRGVERRGDALKVSLIYEEARSFYFPGEFTGLDNHLREFAGDDAAPVIDRTSRVEADVYEYDIADLSNGDSMPGHLDPCQVQPGLEPYNKIANRPDCGYRRVDIPLLVQYYEEERVVKVAKLIRQNRYGRVYVTGEPVEVE